VSILFCGIWYYYDMDIWKHGTYIDTWSLVHFLSGVLLSSLFYKLGFGFTLALVCSFFILLAWEVFEWAITIIEPSANVIMDMVFGTLGFLLGFFLLVNMGVSFWILFCPTALTAFVLSFWGFFDFLSKGYR